MNQSVFILDDDPDFILLARHLLHGARYSVWGFSSFDELKSHAAPAVPAVILLDWKLGEANGLDLISPLRDRFPSTPIIIVTSSPSVELAVEAVQRGAFDFLVKPLDEARLTMTLAKAVDYHALITRLADLNGEQASGISFEGIVGTSPSMQAIFNVIRSVAPTDASVMICGESGTGKELVARAIHRRSGNGGRFVPLNMAALPQDLVESTLFGHERGAFTGADKLRIGAAEEAKGGTLFLDEIGEMRLDLQAKLLRFLQERMFRRVGGSLDIASDARIVCATNRDPLQEVAVGRLRLDLYYRLSVVPVLLPSLRERKGDIPLLISHLLRQIAGRYQREPLTVDAAAMALLVEYSWPGNVRQLANLIERLVVLAQGDVITIADVPSDMHEPKVTRATPPTASNELDGRAGENDEEQKIVPLVELERRAIASALKRFPQSAAEAARHLGISQATIYRKMKTLGLS